MPKAVKLKRRTGSRRTIDCAQADACRLFSFRRKLSLLWHPDKSDDPNADQKFRQLVSVYEILKDEQRRARYDRILIEGLPTWNQPLYYYRRAKKLHSWEILTILTLIITVGHYLVLWAIYFESSLAMVK
jgi:DnaJ homolog subfamily C member 1